MTEEKVYELPYKLTIPGNMRIGHQISLKGKLHSQCNPDGIAISIAMVTSGDKTMAVFIAVRYTQDQCAWLVAFNDDIEPSIRMPVPFKLGENYQITITCEDDGFVIEASGALEPLLVKHNTPLRYIGFVVIDGTFNINELSLFEDVV